MGWLMVPSLFVRLLMGRSSQPPIPQHLTSPHPIPPQNLRCALALPFPSPAGGGPSLTPVSPLRNTKTNNQYRRMGMGGMGGGRGPPGRGDPMMGGMGGRGGRGPGGGPGPGMMGGPGGPGGRGPGGGPLLMGGPGGGVGPAGRGVGPMGPGGPGPGMGGRGGGRGGGGGMGGAGGGGMGPGGGRGGAGGAGWDEFGPGACLPVGETEAQRAFGFLRRGRVMFFLFFCSCLSSLLCFWSNFQFSSRLWSNGFRVLFFELCFCCNRHDGWCEKLCFQAILSTGAARRLSLRHVAVVASTFRKWRVTSGQGTR